MVLKHTVFGLSLKASASRAMMFKKFSSTARQSVTSQAAKLSNGKTPLMSISMTWKRNNSTSSTASESAGSTTSEISSQLQSFSESASTAASPIVDAANQIVGEASSHYGYLESIGLANGWLWPPNLIQHILEVVHVSTGMPWYATIITCALTLRLALIPLYVKQQDNMAKSANIQTKLKHIEDTMYDKDQAHYAKSAAEIKNVKKDIGLSVLWTTVPTLLQVPLALGFFSGLREMCNYPVDGFTNQGALWFQDLSAADPYLGLQCATAAAFIIYTRWGQDPATKKLMNPTYQKVMYVLPLLSIPLTMNLGSGVVLYFAINGLCAIFQGYLLKNPKFRKYYNITEVIKTNEKPLNMSQSFERYKLNAKKRQEFQDRQNSAADKFKKRRQVSRSNSAPPVVEKNSKKYY